MTTSRSRAFFGRAAELELVDQCLRRLGAAAGPEVLLLVGDAGMGKSRLLDEAIRRQSSAPVRQLVGFEPERDVPLGAATALLTELQKGGEAGRRLASLLGADAPFEAQLESLRVLEAATQALLSACPLLLVIDDLQWLDPLSRALVHHALRAAHVDAAPLGLLCASRPSPETADLASSLRKVVPEASFVQVDLGPLDCDAGVALARAVDPSLDERQAQEAWRAGGGSPFWIELTALAAIAGSDPRAPGAVLAAMVRALSPDAATCLAGIALLGKPVPVEDVTAVLGWPDSRVVAAIGELARRGLLALRAETVGTAHDLVREAVLREIPAGEARRLHRRIAQHLQTAAGGDLQLLMEALEHARAGGAPSLRLALAIARSPQRRLIGSAGFERLAAVLDAQELDADASLELRRSLADLAQELGDSEAAYDGLSWLAQELPAAGDRAAAALGAARHAFELGRVPELSAALEIARRDGAGDPWQGVAADALDHDRLVWLAHDRAAAESYLRRASVTARELVGAAGGAAVLSPPARDAFVQVLSAECIDRLMHDDIDGVLRLSRELVEATRGLGDRHLDARLNAALMTRFLNRWPEVVSALTGILAEAQRQVYPRVAADAALELALALYNVGRVAEARDCHDRARLLAQRIDQVREELADTWVCGLRPLIDASAVDWRAAVEALVRESATQDNAHCRLLLHQRAAMLAARFDPLGSEPLVREQLAAANADAHLAECVRCLAEVQIATVELLARIGDGDAAGALLQEWEAAHPGPNARIAFLRDRAAAVLASRVEAGGGGAQLRALVATAAGAGLELDRVWAFLDLGAALAADQPEEAVAAWAAARDLASDLGARSECALAKRRLRTVGVRTTAAPRPHPSGSPLEGLSRRELEVALLAAEGARTAEIAASLFLSAKTVEQHLSRVFSKLGVRNRAELGARFGSALRAAAAPQPS
jgi:DNA-binding CsgD family transcriptional regulator